MDKEKLNADFATLEEAETAQSGITPPERFINPDTLRAIKRITGARTRMVNRIVQRVKTKAKRRTKNKLARKSRQTNRKVKGKS